MQQHAMTERSDGRDEERSMCEWKQSKAGVWVERTSGQRVLYEGTIAEKGQKGGLMGPEEER